MTLVTIKTLPNSWLALGLATHFLARREPFASFKARDLAQTVHGQIERGHYLFAFEKADAAQARVIGYLGWAMLSDAIADRLAAGGPAPTMAEANSGDIAWILTAGAETRAAFAELKRAGRALYPNTRIMAIRHKGGRRVLFDQHRARVAQRSS